MAKSISVETTVRIYNAHREIEACEVLLDEIEKGEKDWTRPKAEPIHKDAFGKRCNLQLGVPSGSNSHRIYHLAPSLAKYIIQAHAAENRKELEQACIVAQMELDGLSASAQRADEERSDTVATRDQH